MSRDVWRGLRRVLALRRDNIGDVLMLGPALRAMRAAIPGARITLMVSRAGARAAPLLPRSLRGRGASEVREIVHA